MRRSSLIRLYPSRWRRRYGDEFEVLLDEERWTARLILDVLSGAVRARLEPYPAPTSEDRAMTARRLENAAAIGAVLLVLPALILLGSAAVRGLQPPPYEPARTAGALFDWFASIGAGQAILVIGPLLALVLGLLAVWRRLADDADLRSDVAIFVSTGGRLLRRPALVAGAVATLGSVAVLAFVLDHAIAG